MDTKKELRLEEYIEKLREAAGKIVHERHGTKHKIIYLLGADGLNDQLILFKEALSRVNKKYELKAEA